MLRLDPPPNPAPAMVGGDDELVAQAQRDRRTFAPLYRRYVAMVYRYCYHSLGNPDAAEDATSLIFEKALAQLTRYHHRDTAGSFRSWLFAIAHNVVVDAFRTARPIRPLDEAAEIEDPNTGPEEQAVSSDEGQRLRAALTLLTADQRRVVELRLTGLSDREIAETLDRPYETIRTLQRRALIRLQAILGITAEPAGEASDANH